jgi:DNA adenine methylase
MKHLNLISYFGGKYPHLSWLIDKFPKGNFHFVDMMCGSANVALNVNYPLITLNDINDNVINLFEVLRNQYDEFIRALFFTPFSRTELYKILDDNENDKSYGKIEWARRYFVKSRLGYGENGSQNNHKGAGFEYKIQKSNFYRVDNWNVKLDKLSQIALKLRSMQIESADVFSLFEKVNKPGSILYFDPPYPLKTRLSKKRYLHDHEDDFHYKLIKLVKNAHCFVAISTFENEMYNDLLSDFYKITGSVNKSTISKCPRKEILFCNYKYSNQITFNLK